jgi:hypothetical protein
VDVDVLFQFAGYLLCRVCWVAVTVLDRCPRIINVSTQ